MIALAVIAATPTDPRSTRADIAAAVPDHVFPAALKATAEFVVSSAHPVALINTKPSRDSAPNFATEVQQTSYLSTDDKPTSRIPDAGGPTSSPKTLQRLLATTDASHRPESSEAPTSISTHRDGEDTREEPSEPKNMPATEAAQPSSIGQSAPLIARPGVAQSATKCSDVDKKTPPRAFSAPIHTFKYIPKTTLPADAVSEHGESVLSPVSDTALTFPPVFKTNPERDSKPTTVQKLSAAPVAKNLANPNGASLHLQPGATISGKQSAAVPMSPATDLGTSALDSRPTVEIAEKISTAIPIQTATDQENALSVSASSATLSASPPTNLPDPASPEKIPVSSGVATFAGSAQDLGAVQQDSHHTLVSNSTMLEIRVQHGAEGWLKIRAEVGSDGISASLSSASRTGQTMLRDQLPAINAFLHDEQIHASANVLESLVMPAKSTLTDGAAMDGSFPQNQQASREQQQLSKPLSLTSQLPEDSHSTSESAGIAVLLPRERLGAWLSVIA